MDALLTDKRNVGIRIIVAAEKDAQQIVNAARTEKIAKLKQAKEEAQTEAAAHRALMEFEFQKKTIESSGDCGANMNCLQQEVEERINQLRLDTKTISHDVINMLLKHVTTVRV